MLANRPVLLFSSFFSIFSLLSQSLTAQGSTCVQAAEITTGNHQTTAITSGNGASHSDAEHAAWYKFVPDRDGLLSVSSCGGGADTRLWVYNGACGALTLVAENDDACDLDSDGGNDNDFASQATLLVEKGNQYFIEWDDKYDNIASILI